MDWLWAWLPALVKWIGKLLFIHKDVIKDEFTKHEDDIEDLLDK